jgi:hypothetical protein
MLIVEIDVIHAETPEGSVTGGAHMVRASADTDEAAVLTPQKGELGGQDHLVPAAAEGASHEFLIRVRTVHVGGVEEGQAQSDGLVAHPHATQVEGRDFQSSR